MKPTRIVLFLLITFFLFLLFSKDNLSGNQKADDFNIQSFSLSIENKLQTGDVILRIGKGFISNFFKELSVNDKKFSHAGIVSVENQRVFVYHIIGGKPGKENQVRKEPLEIFCNKNENTGFAVYRYDLTNDKKQKMVNEAEILFISQIKFDSHFELSTDSEMYCTEFVYKIVNAASRKNNYLPFTSVEGNKFIAPDNLYLNAHATLVTFVDYSKKI